MGNYLYGTLLKICGKQRRKSVININKRKISIVLIAMMCVALFFVSFYLNNECNKLMQHNTTITNQIHILQNEITQKNERILEYETTIINLQLEIKSLKKGLASPTSTFQKPKDSVGSFKSYMDYRAITNKSSPQFKLQQKAYTCERGFRKIGEYYCVALGSFYSRNIGDTFIITLSSGSQFKAILSETKQDRHTDSTNRYVIENGNVVEFVIDEKVMSPKALSLGDLSRYFDDLKGSVTSIVKEV